MSRRRLYGRSMNQYGLLSEEEKKNSRLNPSQWPRRAGNDTDADAGTPRRATRERGKTSSNTRIFRTNTDETATNTQTKGAEEQQYYRHTEN